MGKFTMDTEAVQSIADEINLLKNELNNIIGEISALNKGNNNSGGTGEGRIDFASAIATIEANMNYTSEKFANISAYINDAIAAHTAIQNETTIDFEENNQDSSTTEPTINTEDTNTGGNATYTIKPGDNLSAIANMYGTTVSAILASNSQIKDPNIIYSGDQLVIPKGEII